MTRAMQLERRRWWIEDYANAILRWSVLLAWSAVMLVTGYVIGKQPDVALRNECAKASAMWDAARADEMRVARQADYEYARAHWLVTESAVLTEGPAQ